MSTSPALAARSTADTTSRVAPALSGTLTTLRVTQQAVQSVPIAREIIGAAAQIVEFADRVDKNNEKLRTLADRAAALARDVDEVVTTRGGVEGAIARRLEVLTKAFKNVETFMSQEINTAKSLRRLLRRLFVHPTTVDLLFRDLETAVQSFLLTAALDSRLYIEETAPHDGQFIQLLDCHLKKLDTITARQTEQGTIVYAKARVDGVQELMVVKIHANSSRPTRDDDSVDVLASISNLTTSHPNLVQLYARSARTAATRFTVLRSGVHSAAEYLTGGYADEVRRYGSLMSMFYLVMSASAHLEEMGLIWLPESCDALVVDDYGQPTVGAFDDITSIDSLPQRKRVLALLSTFSAVRLLMLPGHEHFEEVLHIDRCDQGTSHLRTSVNVPLKACVDATRSRAPKLDAIWDLLLGDELELCIGVWKEALPTVDLGSISPVRFVQGDEHWAKLCPLRSWSTYTRRHNVGSRQESDSERSDGRASDGEVQATIECFYIRNALWRGGREVSHGLQLTLSYGIETVVQKDFLVNLSDELATSVQLILEDVPLEGGDESTQYGLFSGVVALPSSR